MKKVYLAGPDVFFETAKAVGVQLGEMCTANGLIGLFPLDNEVSPESKDMARDIYDNNVGMLNACDGVVANISPFRGVNMDPGTSWEIGYAIALKKPVWVYTSSNDHMRTRVKDTGGYERVEEFGMPENLMICVPAERPFHDTAQDAIRAAAKYFQEK